MSVSNLGADSRGYLFFLLGFWLWVVHMRATFRFLGSVLTSFPQGCERDPLRRARRFSHTRICGMYI